MKVKNNASLNQRVTWRNEDSRSKIVYNVDGNLFSHEPVAMQTMHYANYANTTTPTVHCDGKQK